MDKTRIPLDKWFLLFFMIIQERENLRILDIQYELEVSYPTAKLLFEKTKNPEINKWLYDTVYWICQMFPESRQFKAYRRKHAQGGYFVYKKLVSDERG